MRAKTVRHKRRLSALDFERATENMRMLPELKLAAYRYMVERKTFKEVSDESGLNDRSVQRKVREIWEAFIGLPALPSGWVTEPVSLPKDKMRQVQAMSSTLLKRANHEI